VKKILAGCLRASTADVLTKSLPKILLNDSVSMPDKLNFEVRHYNPRMIRNQGVEVPQPQGARVAHQVSILAEHEGM